MAYTMCIVCGKTITRRNPRICDDCVTAEYKRRVRREPRMDTSDGISDNGTGSSNHIHNAGGQNPIPIGDGSPVVG